PFRDAVTVAVLEKRNEELPGQTDNIPKLAGRVLPAGGHSFPQPTHQPLESRGRVISVRLHRDQDGLALQYSHERPHRRPVERGQLAHARRLRSSGGERFDESRLEGRVVVRQLRCPSCSTNETAVHLDQSLIDGRAQCLVDELRTPAELRADRLERGAWLERGTTMVLVDEPLDGLHEVFPETRLEDSRADANKRVPLLRDR